MTWIKNAAQEAKAELTARNERAEQRLKNLVDQFTGLSSMVRAYLQEIGDECFGAGTYLQSQKCEHRIDSSPCWWVNKEIGHKRFAALNVRLVERTEQGEIVGYNFEVQNTHIFTKDTSEHELKAALEKSVGSLVTEIEYLKIHAPPKKSWLAKLLSADY
ncbi:MAG: hypothetical protein HY301_05685 [Verrucomicrobia bacterium]|nr:hypothetical protein [Verrucomicrobiota bacterium]